MDADGTQRFQHLMAALPGVRRWIDDLLARHAANAEPVSARRSHRLARVFPRALLHDAQVVTTANLPFPPLEQLGLAELAAAQSMPFSGITFRNTIFVHPDLAGLDSLIFHELVHVVQWQRLGVDRFLLAYGLGLVIHGYRESPLEQMAYTLQATFDTGELDRDAVPEIERRTEEVWEGVERLIEGA